MNPPAAAPAVHRGSIYWADLGDPLGSAPARRHPVLIVQAESFNRSRLQTVIVAALTSNTALAEYPGNVFLPSRASGLPRDSVVNVTALATLDRDALGSQAGSLPAYLLREVDAGLRLVMTL